MTMSPTGDALRFFCAWLSDPLRVAAIVPSSTSLAELMTVAISRASAPVLELGPGTGVFTRALLAKGVPEEEITLVEHGSDFVRMLAYRFPAARVLWMDAARLRGANLVGGKPFGAAISGLPLLSMRPRKVMAILEGVFEQLGTDGALYQFTYGPRCPVPRLILDRLHLKAARVGATLINIPPASVYRITRRPPRRPFHRTRNEVAMDIALRPDSGEIASEPAGIGERVQTH